MIGIYRKRERLLASSTEKSVIVSLEYMKNESGTANNACPSGCIERIAAHNIQSLLLPSGYARTYGLTLPATLPMIVQLSNASRHAVPAWNRTVVCSALEALRTGADAVEFQLAIGNEYEEKMLHDFSTISEEAHSFGLPVLLSIFAKGDRIVQEYDRALIADSIYLGGELGADIVAVPYSGDNQSFSQAIGGCPSPVLLTGTHGAKTFDAYCNAVENGFKCGAEGVIVPSQLLPENDEISALNKLQELAKTSTTQQEKNV